MFLEFDDTLVYEINRTGMSFTEHLVTSTAIFQNTSLFQQAANNTFTTNKGLPERATSLSFKNHCT